jgi:hypothetical protein
VNALHNLERHHLERVLLGVVDEVVPDLHCKTSIFKLELTVVNHAVAVAAVELDSSHGLHSSCISKKYDSTAYDVQLKG